jgi:adenylate cyclase
MARIPKEMTETRKLAAILAADVVGYSRLAGVDEDRTLARLRTLRSDLIDPTIAVHHGKVVKRTGDGILVEFRSVVDAVRCAIEIQNGMVERNVGLPPERCIEFRCGVHLGDVVEEGDGDLMGDGVNIAARLEGVAKPGTICLSEDAYRQVKSRLDLAVSDLGAQSLKNIAEPVRVYSLEVGKPAQAKPVGPLLQTSEMSSAPRLSIVVLPFANMSGDAEQEYFVDGLTEDLTTELSRMPGAFVIARNTAFTYKGKAANVKQIGKDLGVRYALEGSVRKAGNRIRLNAQLIDTETGAHLWADRFDRELIDLFALQDAVTGELAGVLNIQLVEAETRRGQAKLNPDAFDLVLRGRATAHRGMSRDNTETSLRLFEEALRLDPNSVAALCRVVVALGTGVTSLWSDDRDRDLGRAEAMAMRALALDPQNPDCHFAMGFVRRVQQRFGEAIVEYGAALRGNANFAFAHSELGWAKSFSGLSKEALQHFQESIRLSPRDPNLFLGYFGIGQVHFALGELAEAIEPLRQSLALNPSFTWSNLLLSASLALLGRIEEAQAALAAYFRTNPIAKTIAAVKANTVASRIADGPFYDALRRAGMPDE